jgi:molybdopterin synthase catalytic subunit
MSMGVDLVLEAFDPAALLAAFTARAEGAGGIVSFTGHARSTNRAGEAIEELRLDIYRGMTLASHALTSRIRMSSIAMVR